MLNKKQSIPQVCSWGMGFLETPINKMQVTNLIWLIGMSIKQRFTTETKA